MEIAQHRSEFVTVWKGRYDGRVVAARIVTDSGSDFKRARIVGESLPDVFPSELIICLRGFMRLLWYGKPFSTRMWFRCWASS